MATYFKHLLNINGRRGKSTEAYWSVENSDADAVAAGKRLAELRSQVLGFGADVVALRIAAYDNMFKKQYSLPVTYQNQQNAVPWSGDLNTLQHDPTNGGVLSLPTVTAQERTSWGCDIKATSALVNLTVVPRANVISQTKAFLAFCPDAIDFSETDPNVFKNTQEDKDFQSWYRICLEPFLKFLQNHPFQRKIRDTSVTRFLIGGVASGNSLATPPTFASVTVAGDQRPSFPVGSFAQIRGRNNRRFTGRGKELNGKWQIFQADYTAGPPAVTTLYLVCTVDLVVDICKRLGTIEPVTYQLAPISAYQFLYATGRRRGRRSA